MVPLRSLGAWRYSNRTSAQVGRIPRVGGPSDRVRRRRPPITIAESLTDNAAVASWTRIRSRRCRGFSLATCHTSSGWFLGSRWSPASRRQRLDAATPFKMDLYFGSGYERQIDGRTCTAASTRDDAELHRRQGSAPQPDEHPSIRPAARRPQRREAARLRPARVGEGDDLLRHPYRLVVHLPVGGLRLGVRGAQAGRDTDRSHRNARRARDLERAPRRCHDRLRGDGRPPCRRLLADPCLDQRPVRREPRRYTAAGSPLNAYLELDATPTYDRAWYKKFVIVAPQGDTSTVAEPAPTPVPDGSVVVTR